MPRLDEAGARLHDKVPCKNLWKKFTALCMFCLAVSFFSRALRLPWDPTKLNETLPATGTAKEGSFPSVMQSSPSGMPRSENVDGGMATLMFSLGLNSTGSPDSMALAVSIRSAITFPEEAMTATTY